MIGYDWFEDYISSMFSLIQTGSNCERLYFVLILVLLGGTETRNIFRKLAQSDVITSLKRYITMDNEQIARNAVLLLTQVLQVQELGQQDLVQFDQDFFQLVLSRISMDYQPEITDHYLVLMIGLHQAFARSIQHQNQVLQLVGRHRSKAVSEGLIFLFNRTGTVDS